MPDRTTAIAATAALPQRKLPARAPLLLPLGALAAGFGCFDASAQSLPGSAEPALSLPPVQVSGRAETDRTSLRATDSRIGRSPQDLRDIPQGVTVVTGKLLEERRTDTVKEALHYTAGISFQAAEGGEEDIRLRGFSLTASGDIYADGVRDPAFYDRDVFNFERIELLRGSASMLFGRGSTGGVVNQVSKQPRTDDLNEVSTTIGNGGYLRLGGDFNLQTSDTSALRLNVMSTTAGNHGTPIDKQGIAPAFRWAIGGADEFTLSYFHLENRNGVNYGIPWLRSASTAGFGAANPAVLVPISPRANYAAASDYNASTASYGTLAHTHRFGDGGVWHTVLRHGGFDRDLRASAIRFCVRSATANLDCPATPPTLATIDGSTPLTRGVNNKVQDLAATYLQTDYTNRFEVFGRRHEVLGGIDLAREVFNNYSLALPAGAVLDKNDPRVTLGNPGDGTSVDESLRSKVLNRHFEARALGVYVQDLVELAPHWKLLAGLRWDRFDGDYTSPAGVTAAGAPVAEARRSRSDSLWSQRLGLIWQPTDHSSFYASYGTSFNTSGELYNYDAEGSRTPPEGSRNIEIGAKLDLLSGRLSARAAVFRSTKTNERNRDSPNGAPLDDYLLSGRRHATGLEVDVAGRITRDWEVFMSYAWIPSARIDRVQGTTLTGELEGQRPSLTPRHSGSLFTTYRLRDDLRIGGGLNARSSQTPNRNPEGVAAPGFLTYDAFVEYAVNDLIAVKLNVLNVTDKLYADSIYTGHYIAGQPRTVYVTMTARF